MEVLQSSQQALHQIRRHHLTAAAQDLGIEQRMWGIHYETWNMDDLPLCSLIYVRCLLILCVFVNVFSLGLWVWVKTS